MNIDDLTIKQAKELISVFIEKLSQPPIKYINGMIGKYVIVRCGDAGVHAGTLDSHYGRECVLTESRRLWYWKPADNKSFLSGVAIAGLHPDSKIGAPLPRLHLTENCEIILCTEKAEKSIREQPEHEQ